MKPSGDGAPAPRAPGRGDAPSHGPRVPEGRATAEYGWRFAEAWLRRPGMTERRPDEARGPYRQRRALCPRSPALPSAWSNVRRRESSAARSRATSRRCGPGGGGSSGRPPPPVAGRTGPARTPPAPRPAGRHGGVGGPPRPGPDGRRPSATGRTGSVYSRGARPGRTAGGGVPTGGRVRRRLARQRRGPRAGVRRPMGRPIARRNGGSSYLESFPLPSRSAPFRADRNRGAGPPKAQKGW